MFLIDLQKQQNIIISYFGNLKVASTSPPAWQVKFKHDSDNKNIFFVFCVCLQNSPGYTGTFNKRLFSFHLRFSDTFSISYWVSGCLPNSKKKHLNFVFSSWFNFYKLNIELMCLLTFGTKPNLKLICFKIRFSIG